MRREILKILLDNRHEFVSGEYMGNAMGISRTAVWKHINALGKEGYQIECVSGKGYKLTYVPDVLDSKIILAGLLAGTMGSCFEIHKTIDSTNIRAKQLALEGAPEGMLVLADEQTKGRGRMDRSWVSPVGKGIWMSVILRPPISPANAAELTVVAAVAVAKALEQSAGLKVAIKWPNDIVVAGKKICGILAEIQADPDIIRSVVLGIGINVNMSQKDFPQEIEQTATSVFIEKGVQMPRRQLLCSVLENLEDTYYAYLKQGGLEPLREYYKSRSYTLGENIKVIERVSSFEGYALDLDEDGSLLVKLDDGSIRKVLSADVSVRKSTLKP